MKRKLKIAQVAPIWYPVPPPKYGGIERIVYYLTEGLVKLGHRVTLFASGDSKTSAKLKFWRKRHLVRDKISWQDYFLELEHLAFAFSQANNFDILHCHLGPKSFFFLNFVKIPILYTFHNPIRVKPKTPLFEIAKRYKRKINAVFLTEASRKFCNFKFKRNFIIYNGIDINLFRFNKNPKDYFLWVGRVEPYKGIENAIYAARKTKIKLLLVGKLDPERKEYFRKKIKPNLGQKIRYLGEVSQKKLVKLYQNAICTLYPIEWEEPFGLIMVESMACGTPVIVFDRGSAKEVVKDKKTGFVIPFLNEEGEKNFEGLIKAIKKIKEIKREDCRKWVKNKFSIEKMVKNYEKVYHEILKKS
jgi:glycosyltransferase involved in cell wall biosynthesis